MTDSTTTTTTTKTTTTNYPTWPEMRPLPSDGIAGLYADRALERGADPRVLVSLSRLMRSEDERLPVMDSAFEEGFTVYEIPVRGRRMPGSRRLLVAAAIAALLLPLGAMVAGAESGAEDIAATYASGYGYDGEVDLPEIDANLPGQVFNPAAIGLPFGVSGGNGGSVTVNGRERRNQVDAEVYTSEESTIVIDGEQVESSGRAPMTMPGAFPAIPGF